MSAPGRIGRVRSILVPVDGSPSSRRAVHLAVEMARAFGAELTLLHVAPVSELPVLMAEAQDAGRDEQAELVLGEGAKLAHRNGVEASVVVRRGRVASQILRQLERSKPDLVVMGTRGRSGAQRLLMGSVSRAVARRASAQVVLVRWPRADDRAGASGADLPKPRVLRGLSTATLSDGADEASRRSRTSRTAPAEGSVGGAANRTTDPDWSPRSWEPPTGGTRRPGPVR